MQTLSAESGSSRFCARATLIKVKQRSAPPPVCAGILDQCNHPLACLPELLPAQIWRLYADSRRPSPLLLARHKLPAVDIVMDLPPQRCLIKGFWLAFHG